MRVFKQNGQKCHDQNYRGNRELESKFIDAQNRDQEYLDNRLDDISSSNSNISTQHLEGDQGKKLRNAAETKLKEQQNRLKCLCNEIFKLEIITSK